MFLILLTYKTSLEEVERFLSPHVDFLNHYYHLGKFVVSGRKVPRTGGVILVYNCKREEVEAIIKEDPFYQNDIASYDIIEFHPTMYSLNFESFIDDLE